MDEELGREHCQRAAVENCSPNYRNGYSQQTVKTQLGEIDIKIPGDRQGNYELKIISKYNRNVEGMEDKILSLREALARPVPELGFCTQPTANSVH